MIEHKVFMLLILTGCWVLALQQQMKAFHYVSTLKTFSEAQQYCRETYTDLATIESADDLRVLDTERVVFSGAWIGLKENAPDLLWHWALADRRFYGDGAIEYRNWAPLEPDDGIGQDCVVMTYKGQFQNTNCLDTFNFICYDESGSELYVYISFLYTWREAQRHCRRFYTDLVSVRNTEENLQIQQLIPHLRYAYIGLFGDAFLWSDSSTSSFRNWDLFQPDFLGQCVAILDDKAWMTELCAKLKPFFCYRDLVVMRRQILRLEVKSGVNVNDPAMKTAILSEIHDRLEKLGVTNITKLEWRESADGTVFQKNESEISEQQQTNRR